MKVKSRKQIRKELRKAKKVKKHEFFLQRQKHNVKTQSNQPKPHDKKSKNNPGQSIQKNSGKPIVESGKSEKSKNVKKKVLNSGRREFKNPQERLEFERQRERREREKLEREIEETRIEKLKSDNLKEDEEIKKLEKQLKMKKGKSKAFLLDGLDYLLDVCDKKVSNSEFEKTFQESDSDFESDLENIVGNSNKSQTKGKKKSESNCEFEDDSEDDVDDEEEDGEGSEDELLGQASDFDDDDSDSEEITVKNSSKTNSKLSNSGKRKLNEKEVERTNGKKVRFEEVKEEESGSDWEDSEGDNVGEEEEEEEEEAEGGDSSNEMVGNKKKSMSSSDKKLWEDIYGRTRDESGQVVKTYVPPQLRKEKTAVSDDKSSVKLDRLKKQLKGLLNRLAESNMTFISNQIEQLYMGNSRNDMNETLCVLFRDSLFMEVLTPERLVTEHAMLIAILHSNIGSEIGAHFLQFAVVQLKKALEKESPVENKEVNNILAFIMHLYNFQLFRSRLMYDIINELLKSLDEKHIELVLLTLRTVGFNLRKDDPVALKDLIIKVQEQANKEISTGEGRVKYMLEMLMAIKNNNMTKIPNYNPELVEKLRKSLKMFIRKGNYSTELNISLQDLLNAEEHGRWWIVGSAWSGAPGIQPEKAKKVDNVESGQFSKKLLDLARKQRMNTDVRRNVFCLLMSSEDFLEAFEKLIKLKLKGSAEREIMNVLLHCALQEKNSNPYYMYLANKFCSFDRKYQIMLQYALWDRIKELKDLLPIQITNLAKFVGSVILNRGLPLSVLKVMEFSDLDKPAIKFMRQVLLTILVSDDRAGAATVFKRISNSPKLKLFRESLVLFLQHFVLKNTKNIGERDVSKLMEMAKIAEDALTNSDGGSVF